MCIGRLPASEYGRLIADALKDNLAELRKDDETRMSKYVQADLSEWHALIECCPRITATFQGELSAFREGEEKRLAQLVFLQVSDESRLV